MSWPTAIVLIVMMVCIAKVLNARHRADRGIIEDNSGNQRYIDRDGVNNGDAAELDSLRERIQVLERIATDGNSPDARETRRIAAEIEALREKQGE